MSSFKKRVYEIVAEPPPGDKVGETVNLAILVLIGVNVFVGIFETISALERQYSAFFYWFEFVSVVIFTVEYVLRIWSCNAVEKYKGFIKGRIKLALTPMALVDFVAIAPFYLALLLTAVDLRFVRVLRLFRLFRLFRAGKLADSFGTLVMVVRSKKEELGISLLVLMLILVLSSSMMFLVEHNEPDTLFTSVPATMWWGMMTITTIGYGDMYPVTTLGRILGSIVGFMGICVFALPVGILGSGFNEVVEQKREAEEAAAAAQGIEGSDPTGANQCPHCGEEL